MHVWMHCQGPSLAHNEHGNCHIKKGCNYGGSKPNDSFHNAINIVGVKRSSRILLASKV